MALSKRWDRVVENLTSNGNSKGEVNVADSSNFFVKQVASLRSNTQQPVQVEVKRVFPLKIVVGRVGKGIDDFLDISQFLVADAALIEAPTQGKPNLQPDEIFNSVFQHDPAGALRNLLVSKYGIPIDIITDINGNTRLAVDAAVTVSGITVDLDAFTKVPPDNAIAVGTEDGTKTGVKHALKIGSDGKAEVKDTAADASLASVDSKLNTLGQKASSASVPVVIASDQPPVPVSGTVGTNIDAFTKVPADNVIAVGTEDGTQTGVKHALKIGSDGKAEVKDTAADASLASIDGKLVDLHTTPIKTIQVFTKPWDSITATYPTTTQEIYQSRVGGVGGTVQQTATINYTDATKNYLLDVSVV